MKIAPTNKLLEGQVPNYTLYLGTYTNSGSVTNMKYLCQLHVMHDDIGTIHK